jgi:hypothetical protein
MALLAARGVAVDGPAERQLPGAHAGRWRGNGSRKYLIQGKRRGASEASLGGTRRVDSSLSSRNCGENNARRVTILVLEDGPRPFWRCSKRLLANHGMTVRAARSTAEADDVLVAVCDGAGRAPERHQSSAADTRRSTSPASLKSREPSIRIFFMTGLAHGLRRRCAAGWRPVLHKPLSAQELFFSAAIRRAAADAMKENRPQAADN